MSSNINLMGCPNFQIDNLYLNAEDHYKQSVTSSNQPDLAMQHLDIAIQLKPDFIDALFMRARLYEKMLSFEKADSDLAKIEDILTKQGVKPHEDFYIKVLAKRFDLSLRKGKILEALPHIQRASDYSIRNNYESPLVHLKMAVAYIMWDTDKASKLIQKAVKLDSKDPEVQSLLEDLALFKYFC